MPAWSESRTLQKTAPRQCLLCQIRAYRRPVNERPPQAVKKKTAPPSFSAVTKLQPTSRGRPGTCLLAEHRDLVCANCHVTRIFVRIHPKACPQAVAELKRSSVPSGCGYGPRREQRKCVKSRA